MWERVQVEFGSTGKKRKGPCTKQCAWRKHGSCDTPGGSMPSQTLKHCKIQSRKDAPKMAILEAPCAQMRHNVPTGSTATPKPHLGVLPLLGPHNCVGMSQSPWGCSKSLCKKRLCSCFGTYHPGREEHLWPCKPELHGQMSNQHKLSGPLDRLKAILYLLHPLDRYRTPPAIGSAIGRPLSRPISHPNTGAGVLNRTVLNRRSWAQPRDSGAIVSKTPLKQTRIKTR